MPGANCSIFDCSTSRRHKDISIFKLPAPGTDPVKEKWRKQLINVITKDCVIGASLQRQISKNTLCICERHFSQDQLWICKYFVTVDLAFTVL